MKFKLSPSLHRALKDSRTAVAKWVARYETDTARIAALRAQLEQLPADIERAESKVDPSDEKALLQISGDKTLLVAVGRQLGELEAKHEREAGSLRALVNESQQQVESACGPILREVEARTGAALAALFSGDQVPALLWQSTPFQATIDFSKCRFAGMADPVAAANEALSAIDLLLSGDLPFVNLPEPLPAT